MVTAVGDVSGLSAPAAFSRIALIKTDKRHYEVGETARITGSLFAANEPVTLQVTHIDGTPNGGMGHEPWAVSADEGGVIASTWYVNPDDSAGSAFLLKARGESPCLTAQAAFTDNYFSGYFVVLDQQSANDVPGQVDLSEMGKDADDPDFYNIFWSWDSIDFTSQTGDACALFDYNGNTYVDAVVCGQVKNGPNYNQTANIVQTTDVPNSFPKGWTTGGSPFVFRCDDTASDRCSQPSDPQPYNRGTDVIPGAIVPTPPGSLPALSPPANVITPTDPFDATALNGPGSSYRLDSTLQVNISKSYLLTLAANLGASTGIPYPSRSWSMCARTRRPGTGGNNTLRLHHYSRGGSLVIKKAAGTTDQVFGFTVSPVPSGTPSSYTIQGTDQTINRAGGRINESVTETVPQGGSSIPPRAYCRAAVPQGHSTPPSKSVTLIKIESGKATSCMFTDVQCGPAVMKANDADHDNGIFNDPELPADATYPWTVTYEVTINNSSVSDATITSISDDKTADISTVSAHTPSCGSPVGNTITAGTTTRVTTTYIRHADTAQVVNTATVVATSIAGADTETTLDSELHAVAAHHADEDAEPDDVQQVGDVITYTLVATNDGMHADERQRQ